MANLPTPAQGAPFIWVVPSDSTGAAFGTVGNPINITGSITASSGSLTNNNAAPSNNNQGVLPAIANAAAPTWTEGNQVLQSVDLSGNQRVNVSDRWARQVGQVDIARVLGAAMSANNPVIDADIMRYALINGTLYSLGLTATSTGASSAAIAIFGGAGGISKNTLILSVFGSSIGNQVVLKAGTIAALDANVATNTTPAVLKAGGSASLYTGSNAAINAPTGTSNPAYTGSFFRYITEQANVAQELAITGVGLYYIPANTANAGFEIVLVQGSAAGVYALNLIWAEF